MVCMYVFICLVCSLSSYIRYIHNTPSQTHTISLLFSFRWVRGAQWSGYMIRASTTISHLFLIRFIDICIFTCVSGSPTCKNIYLYPHLSSSSMWPAYRAREWVECPHSFSKSACRNLFQYLVCQIVERREISTQAIKVKIGRDTRYIQVYSNMYIHTYIYKHHPFAFPYVSWSDFQRIA